MALTAAPPHAGDRRDDGQIRYGFLAGGFGLLDELFETLRIPHGDIGQHFPIQLDSRFLQAEDEASIGKTVFANGCVDPKNPQAPEIALFLTLILLS